LLRKSPFIAAFLHELLALLDLHQAQISEPKIKPAACGKKQQQQQHATTNRACWLLPEKEGEAARVDYY
jgi:hypothetical protein